MTKIDCFEYQHLETLQKFEQLMKTVKKQRKGYRVLGRKLTKKNKLSKDITINSVDIK